MTGNIEILVIRDPDNGTDVHLYIDGRHTNDAMIWKVDAGAGWEADDWLDDYRYAERANITDAFRDAVLEALAEPPGKQYIDDFADFERAIASGEPKATYHGIVTAECLECGEVTTDTTSLELLNDLDPHCRECGKHHIRWTLKDGTQTITRDE